MTEAEILEKFKSKGFEGPCAQVAGAYYGALQRQDSAGVSKLKSGLSACSDKYGGGLGKSYWFIGEKPVSTNATLIETRQEISKLVLDAGGTGAEVSEKIKLISQQAGGNAEIELQLAKGVQQQLEKEAWERLRFKLLVGGIATLVVIGLIIALR